MERKISKTHIFVIIFFFICTVYIRDVNTGPSIEHYLRPPPDKIEYFHFGFRESLADSFWLRWIQDNDACETAGINAVHVAAPTEEEKKDWLYNPHHRSCDHSWSFQILDSVTKLDPRFKMPYLTGGVMLSVVTEDYVGASVILERGLKAYPDDWQLTYLATYHYLFDRHDEKRAAELAIRAAALGGPAWLTKLAARLYTRSGQLELGIVTLQNYKKLMKDDSQAAKMDERIHQLKDEMEHQKKDP